MTDETAVVIPSMGRAELATTPGVLPFATICVPESEADEYREHQDVDVWEHPDDVVGLAAKRQWIIDELDDRPVLMVDDDITSFRRTYIEKGEDYALEPDVARAVIAQVQSTAEELGVYLWGFKQQPNPAHYTAQRPFRLTGYVGGHNLGFNPGHKLWFRSDMVVGNDYWISGLNAYHHRLVFVDERFSFFQRDTFEGVGGQANYRTMQAEREAYAILKSAFGEAVSRKKGTHQASIRHHYQRNITVPW